MLDRSALCREDDISQIIDACETPAEGGNMKLSKILNQLLVTTALGGALVASSTAAQAQTAAGSEGVLSEVVVTATRQADTVSKVALSVTAVTQRALDQQGVTEVKDLQRIVPSLQVSQSSGGGVASQFSIRGVSSGAGAAVTGVYLDDTSLTKRNQNGVSNLNGTPAPPLYDLERVEVLRGPQGTLYGGSAMGGAIRFCNHADVEDSSSNIGVHFLGQRHTDFSVAGTFRFQLPSSGGFEFRARN